MKKLLLIVPIALLFSACSKNDNAMPALTPKTATISSILGTWKLTADTGYITENGKITTAVNIDPIGGTITYAANGAGSSFDNGNVFNFNYGFTDSVITLSVNGENSGFVLMNISTTTMLVRSTQGTYYLDALFIKQ